MLEIRYPDKALRRDGESEGMERILSGEESDSALKCTSMAESLSCCGSDLFVKHSSRHREPNADSSRATVIQKL